MQVSAAKRIKQLRELQKTAAASRRTRNAHSQALKVGGVTREGSAIVEERRKIVGMSCEVYCCYMCCMLTWTRCVTNSEKIVTRPSA